MKKSLAGLLALLLLAACAAPAETPPDPSASGNQSEISGNSGQSAEPPADPKPEPEPILSPREQTVAALLAEMTLEEKVGQLFFVRCPADGAAEKAGQYHLGGYLLFGRDFRDKTAEQVSRTIQSYQDASKIPLLIGVDEEGGAVRRISANSALWPHTFKSPQWVYAHGGLENVTADTAEKCGMLRTYGVNVNFAPVADVSTDPGDFIYDRAIGQDAAGTSAYAAAVVAAMEDGGIGSVLKHFPGYGGNVDTHTGIAVDERPYETFTASDFLPFESGIAAGADAVLVSHNIVTCLDGALPASLSPAVHDVLRRELGFDGVILTDDLAMDAVAAYARDGSVAVLAALAGNDMIVTTDFEAQIPLVIAAVEDGDLPEAAIDRAVERVLGWKYDLGLIG